MLPVDIPSREEIGEDDEFWRFQAHSLAVLVAPGKMVTFRLPPPW